MLLYVKTVDPCDCYFRKGGGASASGARVGGRAHAFSEPSARAAAR